MMVSLFAVGAYAQKAPKRQGFSELLDIDNLYGNVAQVTVACYSINKPGEDISKIEPFPVQVYKFNQRGDVSEMGLTMLEGYKIKSSYDSNGREIWRRSYFQTENGAWVMTIACNKIYGSNGKVSEQHFYYDGAKVPTFKARTKYNANAQPISESTYSSDTKQWTTYNTYKYDAKGLLVEHICLDYESGEDPYKTSYKYDDKGRKIEECEYDKNENGTLNLVCKITYSYGANGKLAEEKRLLADGTVASSVVYKYNSDGKLVEKIDGEINERTTYSYDSKGNVIEELSYAGNSTTPNSITKYTIVYR